MVNVQFKLSSEDLTKLWSYSPSYDLIGFFYYMSKSVLLNPNFE